MAVLPDEKQETTVGFLSLDVALLFRPGCGVPALSRKTVMPTSHAAVSRLAAPLLSSTLSPRAYTPRTNVKAERLSQAICWVSDYSMPFQRSEDRNCWLLPYLSIYNPVSSYLVFRCLSPKQLLSMLLLRLRSAANHRARLEGTPISQPWCAGQPILFIAPLVFSFSPYLF